MTNSIRTKDPIADMEAQQADNRPLLGYCEICGCEIHGGTALYDPDDAYDIESVLVCGDHLKDYFEDCKLK